MKLKHIFINTQYLPKKKFEHQLDANIPQEKLTIKYVL